MCGGVDWVGVKVGLDVDGVGGREFGGEIGGSLVWGLGVLGEVKVKVT